MKNYTRVSEILAWIEPYEGVDPVVLEQKAVIGTNVHNAIVKDCSCDFVVHKGDREQAYFGSYEEWRRVNQEAIVQVPRLYCDKLMITGECDGLRYTPQGKMLIDWKTSANPKENIWEMQAHYYWYLLKENGYDVLDTMLWVNLQHHKHTFRDSKTGAIKKVTYSPKSPVVFQFKFSEKVLSDCIEKAILYNEEKFSAKVIA